MPSSSAFFSTIAALSSKLGFDISTFNPLVNLLFNRSVKFVSSEGDRSHVNTSCLLSS